MAVLNLRRRPPAFSAGFSADEKAYYADPSLVLNLQPGLNITVVSAKIAANGAISVDYKLTDPTGAALDQTGVTTPGPSR